MSSSILRGVRGVKALGAAAATRFLIEAFGGSEMGFLYSPSSGAGGSRAG